MRRLQWGLRASGALALAAAVACSGSEEGDDGPGDEQDIQAGTSDTQHGFAVGIALANGAVCSGVLIAPNLVMTAQHCVSDAMGGRQINCASSSFSQRPLQTPDVTISTDVKLPGKSQYRVLNVVVPQSNEFCGSDMALLVLSKNVPDSEAKPATPVLRPMNKESGYSGKIAAIGYGVTSAHGKDAGERRIRENIAISCLGGDSKCKSDSPREFHTEGGVCQGDSGSGAFDESSISTRTPKVMGILSRVTTNGETCSTGVYTRTDMYSRLIIATAIEAARRGNYDAPEWARGDGKTASSPPFLTGGPISSGQQQPPPQGSRPPRSQDTYFGNGGWGSILDWIGTWLSPQKGAQDGGTRYDLYGNSPFYDAPGYNPLQDPIWDDGVFRGDGGLPDAGVDAGQPAAAATEPAGGDRTTPQSTEPPSSSETTSSSGDDPPATGDPADAGAKKKAAKKASGCSASPARAPSPASSLLALGGIAALLMSSSRRRRRDHE
jgi:hypothetical protein